MSKPVDLNSSYLKWYKEIEKSLWRFFRLFENLCFLCFRETIIQINKTNLRNYRQYWCCCVIDNQIHDNWESLKPIQERISGKNWYQEIKIETELFRKNISKRRLPGNGPCPALGETGCLLKRFRPITCTTQLCEKMLFILARLKIAEVAWDKPMQIEDIIRLPNILKALYGIENNPKITRKHARQYIQSVNKLGDKLMRVDISARKLAVDDVIVYFLNKGGKS